MAGLDDINPTNPAGNETPTLGDNRIRALAAKIIEAFGIEHALAGEHTFLVGSAAQRPAAGHEGRFFILTAAGVAVELQYDTGSAWVNITSNQTTTGQSEDLAAHIAANPIDHPDDSVTSAKILAGNILAKHLDAASGNASIAALVDGSNADALHIHASTDQNIAKFTSSATWTCPAGITLVEFEGWAGGGGGGCSGGGGYDGGGGGGGGGYVKERIVVVPGTEYAITVGMGGNGASSTAGGDTGGQTRFEGDTVIAYGGDGGAEKGVAGVGGGFTAGKPGLTGENGEGSSSPLAAGDGGAGAMGGSGGVGGDSGTGGTIPGGGGGGRVYCGGSAGNGANGLAYLSW